MSDASLLIAWMLRFCALYVSAGFIFACYFVLQGACRLDKAACGATRLTRALWFPAAMLLWPVLWWSLLHLKQDRP